MKIRAWIQAFRPAAAVNVMLPLFLGGSLGYLLDEYESIPHLGLTFFLLFIYALLFQGTIVFLNDYADVEADRMNDLPSLFAGGSRVIQDQLLAPQDLKSKGLICAGGTIAIGALLSSVSMNGIPLLLTVLGLLLLYSYSFRPLRLNYRGGGEFLQVIGVAIILPIIGYTSMEANNFAGYWGDTINRLAEFMWNIRAYILFQSAAAIAITLPDIKGDIAANKNTLASKVGILPASIIAWLLMLIGILHIDYSEFQRTTGLLLLFPAITFYTLFKLKSSRRHLLIFTGCCLMLPAAIGCYALLILFN